MGAKALRWLVIFSWPLLQLTAQTAPAGTLRVAPAALQFTGIAGGGATPSQTLYIINDTSFQANVTGQWSGSYTGQQGTFQLQATFTQTGSTFTGTVTSDTTDPISGTIVGISFTFVIPGEDLTVGTGTFTATSITGTFVTSKQGKIKDSGTFSFTRQGTPPAVVSTLNWTQQGSVLTGASGWLVSQPASGSSTAGSSQFSTISVSAQTAGLAAGQYSGQILVSSSGAANSPVAVSVLLTVVAASTPVAPQVRPTGLIFIGGGTAPPPQSVQISTASTSTVQATLTAGTQTGGNWLSASPASVSLSNSSAANLTVTASTGGLATGVYQGQVNLAFSDSSPQQTVAVLLVVPSAGPQPAAKLPFQAACGATTLLAVDRSLGTNFTTVISWPVTLEALAVDDCGNLVNNATVVASFSNGDPPVAMRSVGNGLFQGTWRPVIQSATLTVTATLTQPPLKQAQVMLSGKTGDNPNVPAIFSGGMVSAASYTGATLSPGGIISIFGKNLAQPGVAASLPLPTELGGLQLTAAGQNLPLFFTSAGQVNAQLPMELNTGTTVAVVARTKLGGSGNPVLAVPEVITVGPVGPGIFSLSQDGKGQGVIVDASNRLLDGKQATATAGQTVVIYCTGLGATTPVVASGFAAPSNPLAQITPPPTVTVGGQSATVSFAGLTPGLVGLYQVNVVVPAGATGSAVPVVIVHKGISSNTVTMSLR